MRFTVSMKDPDTLHDSIRKALERSLPAGLDEEEQDALLEQRESKVAELCGKWFEHGEYLTVEIDTEAMTCTVLGKAS